jgi:hypothetical protein
MRSGGQATTRAKDGLAPYVRGSCRTAVSRDCAAITARDHLSASQSRRRSWRKYGRLARGQGGVVLDVERIEALGVWK